MKAFYRYVCFLCIAIGVVVTYRSAVLDIRYLENRVEKSEFSFDYFDHMNKLRSCYGLEDLLPNNDQRQKEGVGNRSDLKIKQVVSKQDDTEDENNGGMNDINKLECRMETCFDFGRCKLHGQNVKIYVYPIDDERVSETFLNIVKIIKSSKYYEPDLEKACLFISDLDTLDRDPLSPNYQKYPPKMNLLHAGKNHIMFNLYSGTWPNYSETDFSGLDYPDYAILVKASMSHENYRKGFDISFPLFSQQHPQYGPPLVVNDMSDSRHFGNFKPEIIEKKDDRSKKYLLTFKGKRYVYGIGSETRNSLHHLHNGRDILIYTTCKHGKKWKELEDERCEDDNVEYDKHDFQGLIENSTFCVIPRGRRMGSYRFLEALQRGCIPIVLSNSWKLPFSEVIDWSKAVIILDERLLFQIPEQIRNIPVFQIETMRSQCVFLYNTYFASLERIISTTITIIEDRIDQHWARESFLWNVPNQSPLGALWIDYTYSKNLDDFPQFSIKHQNQGFTALITVSRTISFARMIKFLTNSLMTSNSCRQILILWTLETNVPQELLKIGNIVEERDFYERSENFQEASDHFVKIIPIPGLNQSQHTRFLLGSDRSVILTDAVFQLDPESSLITEEIDFAYHTWESFPERIIGFTARNHYFDSSSNQWTYTSKWTNQFSIVLLDAAIYHRYYNFLYGKHIMKNSALASICFDDECSDIAFNFLISHMTREAPIKVTQRKSTVNPDSLTINSWKAFLDRKLCFHKLIQLFGYIPLIKSRSRFEPLLYKDAVSAVKKKYLKMESVV